MAVRPSRAEVVAFAALLVALGGTGYAAVGLRPGSVGTPALKDGAVTARKLGQGAVTKRALKTAAVESSKIARGAVRLDHLSASSVTSIAIAPQNVTVDKIDPNLVARLASVGSLNTRRASFRATIPADSDRDVTLGCRAGEVLLGGGFAAARGITVYTSAPNSSMTRWVLTVRGGASAADVLVYAACGTLR